MDVKRPLVVKIAMAVFGIQAAMMAIACKEMDDLGSVQAVAYAIRAIVMSVAFIAILSNTKAGRVISIIGMAIMALVALFGYFAAIASFKTAPMLAWIAIAISSALLWLSHSYVFGISARAYYAAVLNKAE